MANKKTQWLLPTNTENLRMIIAQGLISSSDGFSKYYSDLLKLVPNHIPLFKNEISANALNYVCEEEKNLTPVILEIDLNKISYGKKILDGNKLENFDGDVNDEELLFILAPLPITVISTLIFSSPSTKNDFIKSSKLYSNLVLNDLKLSSTKAEQELFKSVDSLCEEPDLFGSECVTTNWSVNLKKIDTKKDAKELDYKDYQKVYAYGGLLLNLFYFAKNGKLSNDNFNLFCDFSEENKSQDIDIYEYFKGFDFTETDIKKKMDKGIIDIAINSGDFKEDIIKFLENEEYWGNQAQKRRIELANKLKDFESNNKIISEKFKETKKPLEKILMMLFLREDTESLMEYTLELFSEEDYLNFAMMFGIRDKFIKAPKFLREFDGLQEFISIKMAAYAHKILGSKVEFQESQRPLTIFEMLKNDRFKGYFAKELEIESCFQTIIPKTDYQIMKGKPVFEGIVMPKFEILEDKYFCFMSSYNLMKYNEYFERYRKLK